MSKHALAKRLSVVCLIVGVNAGGCDGGGGGLGPLVILEASWNNEANPDHRLNFTDTATVARRQGNFTGFEVRPGEANDFAGTFATNGSIQFVVERPTGDVTFRGTIDDTGNRIVFTAPSAMSFRRQ